jgi:phospholipid/cholesterol/gamma-HCH transport system substrate-binding protein
MNSQRSKEIQVGLMVLIGVVILIAGLMFFKRINLKTNMQAYAVDIPAVEGLRSGDRVQVRGIRVGQVTGFEFKPGAVRVHMEIEDWVELFDDAEVVLVMKGLVGEVLLEIEPGEGQAVSPGHVFSGRSAASMIALGDKVNEALNVVTGLGHELQALVAELRDQDRLLKPLAAAEHTFAEAGGLLQENRASLRQLTAGLTTLTETLQGALGDGKLDSTITVTREAAAGIEAAMIELRDVAHEGRVLLARLERGEGTLGRLVGDESLYDRADSTLLSLERLIDQMRRNPKAVFKMSLF